MRIYLQKTLDNKEDSLPWETLRYLIGQAMYGGRVTDGFDRECLVTYLDEYMGDFLFDKNRPFFFAKTETFGYIIPENITKETLIDAVDTLPPLTEPAVFGLNSNAEITYYQNFADEIWKDLLKMQTSGGGAAGGGNSMQAFIIETASGILSKLPKLQDVMELRKAEGDRTLQPTKVVLFQELDLYNAVLKVIKKTLEMLIRGLNGEIGMNQELDNIATSLYNNQVPAKWAHFSPQSEKSLSDWMQDLYQRDAQYVGWIKKGEPKVMWLSGLHYPAAYMTALIQTCCRAQGWPLDNARTYTVVTKMTSNEEVKKRPTFGCYVEGLYLEGARWSIEKGCLER